VPTPGSAARVAPVRFRRLFGGRGALVDLSGAGSPDDLIRPHQQRWGIARPNVVARFTLITTSNL
jgi:hypothetical protein